MNNKITIWLLAGTMLVYATASTLSHSGATGVVKQRMDGMVMLGAQIKLLTPMLVANQPKDFNIIKSSSQIIAQHGGAALADLFPLDSIKGPSVARPEIWSRWPEFQALAAELEFLGQELEQSADRAMIATIQQPVKIEVEEELSAWDQLNVDVLLGIKSPGELASEANEATLEEAENTLPRVRNVGAIYTDILATCSSCHTSFRRSR